MVCQNREKVPEVRNFKLKPINEGDDIFSLLNIKATTIEKEVRNAYLAFSRIYHPDKFRDQIKTQKYKEHL